MAHSAARQFGGIDMRRTDEGLIYVEARASLPEAPRNITERLAHWAREAPGRTFLSDRGPDGGWRSLNFAQTHECVLHLAQYLLDKGLSAERPLVALSGNDLELGLLTLAALHVGVPVAPVSPAYSLVAKDFSKLEFLFELVTPGLVYVADGAPFTPALKHVMQPDIGLLVRENPPEGMAADRYPDALATEVTDAVAGAHAATGPDTIAKFLFTSGTTGQPKAVINTQRMLCVNQVMIAEVWDFFKREPPVLVDWLPWNHTAGGNHNFGLCLFNGGSYYIDNGNPTPAGIEKSVRNLSDVSPTFYSSVPKGYEELVRHLETNADLRRSFFARRPVLQYAGAGLSQHVWDTMSRLYRDETGDEMLMVTGYGSTETAPFAFATTDRVDRSGHVGLPAPGLAVKLVPDGEKLEVRLKGPSITPGYWRRPELTKAAFDEEGYYRIGDALAFADPDDPERGFLFDGRITEDFKLSTGTWVDCAGVRSRLIAAAGNLIRDVVLVGPDRPRIGGIIFPDFGGCRSLAGAGPEVPEETVLAEPKVVAAFQDALNRCAAEGTGSSTYISRAIIASDPPSMDANEVTDKGSLNHRAIVAARPELVTALFTDTASKAILIADPKA